MVSGHCSVSDMERHLDVDGGERTSCEKFSSQPLDELLFKMV
jgi:hypothetical protein